MIDDLESVQATTDDRYGQERKESAMGAETLSERGFKHMPPVPSQYGGEVRVYESSAASGPHIWVSVTCPVALNVPDGPMQSSVAHLSLENAEKLRDQLTYLIDHHYQVSDGRGRDDG